MIEVTKKKSVKEIEVKRIERVETTEAVVAELTPGDVATLLAALGTASPLAMRGSINVNKDHLLDTPKEDDLYQKLKAIYRQLKSEGAFDSE